MHPAVLSLRLRVFLFFAMLALTAPAFVAAAIWLTSGSPDAETPRLMATYTAIASVMSALVTLLVWQLFDRYIASALQSLARQMQTALHAENPCPLDDEQLCYLGPVGEASSQLIQELQRLRNQSVHTQAEAKTADDPEARGLARIIRDLDTGILVMNQAFEVLLYNRCAFHLLSRLSPGCVRTLGLGRSAGEWLPMETLHQLASEVHANTDLSGNGAIGAATLRLSAPGQETSVRARMHITRDESGLANGYALILEALAGPAENSAGATGETRACDTEPGLLEVQWETCTTQDSHTRDSLPERPEFYDFDLFDRKLPKDLSNTTLSDLDFVVFDTETTGLRPSEGDEIISMAAVRIVNGRLLPGEYFDELVHPGRKVPPQSTRFHGITDEMLVDKPDIRSVLPQFSRFVGQSVLVAHNAAFDMKFLELKSELCQLRFSNPVLDTVLLSAWLHDHTNKHTLDDLAERYGIDITNRHSALGDSLATARVFLALIRQLESRNVNTLQQALSVSERMTHIKRAQKSY